MSPKNYLLIAGSLLILAAILATGCTGIPATTPSPSPDLKKFNSTAEIEQYLNDSMALDQQGGYYGTSTDVNGPQRSEMVKGAVAVPAALPAGLTGTVGYSQTNVQVAGVDEPTL